MAPATLERKLWQPLYALQPHEQQDASVQRRQDDERERLCNNSFNILRKCTDEGVYAIQRSPAASGGMLLPSEDGMLLEVSQAPCSGFPFRIVKKTDNPDGMEEVMAEMKGEEAQLISCNRHGNRLAVEAQESGMLKIYSFDGRLVKSVRCTAGKNEVGLPVQNVGWFVALCGNLRPHARNENALKAMY